MCVYLFREGVTVSQVSGSIKQLNCYITDFLNYGQWLHATILQLHKKARKSNPTPFLVFFEMYKPFLVFLEILLAPGILLSSYSPHSVAGDSRNMEKLEL